VGVKVNYGKAAAHNDKAQKADTGSALSLEQVEWPVDSTFKAPKGKGVLNDAGGAGVGEELITWPSMEKGGDSEQEHGGEEQDQEQPVILKWPRNDSTQHLLLDHPEGACIEDGWGTLLALRLPGVLLGIHVGLICILDIPLVSQHINRTP